MILEFFSPFSFALGTAAYSWLAYMDRLLTDSLDEIEKKLIEEKMLKLVDLYYLALDAPKTGNKVSSNLGLTHSSVSNAFTQY